jgi:hypothetical protein
MKQLKFPKTWWHCILPISFGQIRAYIRAEMSKVRSIFVWVPILNMVLFLISYWVFMLFIGIMFCILYPIVWFGENYTKFFSRDILDKILNKIYYKN